MYYEGLEPIRLTPDQCWTRLHGERIGRVGLFVAEAIEILPVNYRSVDRTIFFDTSSAVFLAAVDAGEEVAFEVDGHDDWVAWSVVAHGTPIVAADGPPAGYEVRSLHPTPKAAHLRIVPKWLEGRLFDVAERAHRDDEPM